MPAQHLGEIVTDKPAMAAGPPSKAHNLPVSTLSTPSAPIGVYDSGVGGLAVLRALRQALPGESFAYVADSAHAPYGDRSAAFVAARASHVAGFFVARNAKALVLACNTASVVAARRLRRLHALPIVAMEPAIKPATRVTRSGVVLVLATTNTIQSPAVARLCSTYGEGVRIILQPCPGLADRVERGAFDDVATGRLLEQFIRPGLDAGADTIVLGCTHYAFLARQISKLAGASVAVLEPSAAIARQLVRRLPPSPAVVNPTGSTSFYTTGSVPELRNFLEAIGERAECVHPLPIHASKISRGTHGNRTDQVS